eukprot:Skav204328  [mRNA]  locus=scaffold1960:17677:39417:- [translate_table: standard]
MKRPSPKAGKATTAKAMKKAVKKHAMKDMKAEKATTAKAMKAVKQHSMKAEPPAKAVKAMKGKDKKAAGKGPGKSSKGRKGKKSKVAVGRWSKWRVYVGWKEKTVGRLKKKDFKKNRRGRVVYKKMSDQAKERMKTSKISTWYQSVKEARRALNLVGFVPVGGKTVTGQALLAKTKVIYYERVYGISAGATEAVLAMMTSPVSPAPTSPGSGGPAQPGPAQPTRGTGLSSPEIIEVNSPDVTSDTPNPGGPASGSKEAPAASKASEVSQDLDDVHPGGQEAC